MTQLPHHPGHALAAPLIPEGQLALIRADLGADPEQQRVGMYNAAFGPSIDGAAILGQPIEAVGYIVHPAESSDEDTGEIRTYLRTVILTAQGGRVAVGSDVIPRRLRDVERYLRPAPWQPPLTLIIKDKKGKRGRTYFTLEVVNGQAQPPAQQ